MSTAPNNTQQVASPPAADSRLLATLKQRRDPEQQKQHGRALMQDRLTSLWSPVVAFLCCFVPYVVLVELWPGSAAVAQPTLKLIGLGLVAWYFGALVYRLARPAFRELRKARLSAEELLLQLDRELSRRGVERATREKLLEQAVAVDLSVPQTDAKKLQADVDRLTGIADKYLEGWRGRSSVAGVRGLFLTLLGVALLRTVIVEPFKIPSGSMIPTLQIGDHVVVNRFIYGVRIPWLNKVPFVVVRRPRAGDVIVFNNPRNETVDFIKRVIAVPGDTVEILPTDQTVVVNGKPLRRELVEQNLKVDTVDDATERWMSQWADRFLEHGPHKTYSVLQAGHHRPPPEAGPWKVPEDTVFVLGDNRDNSSDSRYGFAVDPEMVSFVPYGHIKGKAMVIWLSLCHDGLGSSLPFWPFKGSGLCASRMFTPVR